MLDAYLFNSLIEVLKFAHHRMSGYNDELPHDLLGKLALCHSG